MGRATGRNETETEWKTGLWPKITILLPSPEFPSCTLSSVKFIILFFHPTKLLNFLTVGV